MQDHIARMLAMQINASAEGIIRAQGMVAENMESQRQGEAMSFVDSDFSNLADSLGLHHNARVEDIIHVI